MIDNDLMETAKRVLAALKQEKKRVVTAESCTGGLVAAVLTAPPGASDCVEGGFVTYSNKMKQEVLGVVETTLARDGAVSEATVVEMAFGALAASEDADIAVAISGIAGPGGGSDLKPVGTVCFCFAVSDHENPIYETLKFEGDRETIRHAATEHALNGILRVLNHA